MKQALRFILAGVVALLAVSCYDDSALQEKIEKIDDRLTAVENSLNKEAEDLAALVKNFEALQGKVAAIKVETKDGVTTLTLSNETSVVLSKDGVLTMVDGGWATVAPNGEVTPLNIPVSQKLKFVVEGGILKVSYDNGKTYESTGVEISESTAHVIGNVVVAEDGKSVAVTIGDNTLNLPLVSSAVATLGLSRDSFFLRYDAEKAVEITAEGLEDVYVMNEPDGWRASIDGNVLTIESPTKKAVDADAAAAKGLVLVHATTTEGKCVVAKLEVSTGKGLTLSLTNGVLTFTNAYASLAYDYWGEPMGYSFTDFAVGIVPASEFVDDPAGYIASLANWEVEHAGENGYMYNNWNLEFTQFEEGVYEVDVIEYAVKDFCAWLMWDTELYPDHDVEVGVPYVIWATPVNDRGEADPSQVEYVTYTKILSEGEVSEITHNDALLSLELMGADKYFVGLVSQAELATYGVDLEAYMANSAPWGYMTQGYVDWIENFYEDGAHEVAMSVLNGYYEPVKLQPGTKYYYWVVPHTVGTVYNDYATQFAPYVKEFATADLTVGDVALSVEKTVEAYYNLAATVTVADSTTVYYNFYTSEEWAEFDEDDDAILSALLGMTNYNDPLTETTVVEETCEPGQTVICAAVAVSDAGVRSAIATASFQAPVIAKNQATMSLKSLMTTATGYKAVVNVEGAAKVCGYNISDTSRDYYVKFLTKEVAKNSANTACQWVDVVDGTATIEFPLNTYKKDYYVMAYNADADGNLVDLSDVFVFNIAENVFQFDVAKVEIGGGTLLNLAAPWSEIEAGSKNYDIYVKMNTAAGVEWTVTATKNGEAYTDPNSPMLSKTYAGDAQSDHMWVPLNITNDPIEWALTVTTTYAGEEVSKTVQFTQKGAPIVENDTFEITRAFNGGVGNLNLTEPWSEIPATFVTNMADGTTDFYVVVDATKTWTVSVTKDGEPYSHSGGVFGKEYAGSHQSDHIWITPNTTDKPVQWAITVTALVNGEQVAKTIEFTQKAAN